MSVAFNAGQVHTILGENGSGKSTLVKLLTGVVEPNVGAILVDGQPVDEGALLLLGSSARVDASRAALLAEWDRYAAGTPYTLVCPRWGEPESSGAET